MRAEHVAALIEGAGFANVTVDTDMKAIHRGQSKHYLKGLSRGLQHRYAIVARKPMLHKQVGWEAIAGEFADENEDALTFERTENGSLLVNGWIDIRQASKLLDVDLVNEVDRCLTLAGLILSRLGHLPSTGETVVYGSLSFEVVARNGRNVDKVRISQSTVSGALAPAL